MGRRFESPLGPLPVASVPHHLNTPAAGPPPPQSSPSGVGAAMAEAVISPVVPPPPAAHRGGRPVRGVVPVRGPLPLPQLAAVRTSATVYGLAVLDCRGR